MRCARSRGRWVGGLVGGRDRFGVPRCGGMWWFERRMGGGWRK